MSLMTLMGFFFKHFTLSLDICFTVHILETDKIPTKETQYNNSINPTILTDKHLLLIIIISSNLESNNNI